MTDTVILYTEPRRTPSLREIRKNCPENVTILPNASPRQVQQKCNRKSREAARILRETQSQSFPYLHYQHREAKRRAKILRDSGKSAEKVILAAMIELLEEEQKQRLWDKMESRAAKGSQSEVEAFEWVRLSFPMSFAEKWDLMNALDRLDD